VSDQERAERRAQLDEVIEVIRPAVQADGGDLVVVSADVETGVVELELQGSCSSCAISTATLQGGVSRILRDRLPWVTDVIGGVDATISVEQSVTLGRGGDVPRS